MAFIVDNSMAGGTYLSVSPVELAMKSTEMLPGNVPARSVIWVTDKMDIAVYDGDGNWYREADKPVAVGQPISALF
jgi:hypothetical protein